jgi:hypothetical protein
VQHGFLATLVAEVTGHGSAAVGALGGGVMILGFSVHGKSA